MQQTLTWLLQAKVLKSRVLAWGWGPEGPKKAMFPVLQELQALPPPHRNDVTKGTEPLYLQVAPRIGGSDLRVRGTHV